MKENTNVKGCPSSLVVLDNFGTGEYFALGYFVSKRWTKAMIALLGKPERRNKDGVPSWSMQRIIATTQSSEFYQELVTLARKRLAELGVNKVPESLLNKDLIVAGCTALYDLNKHIKAKKFTAASVKKAYELKTTLLEFLYENKYADLLYEEDTNLFRFTIHCYGREYVWHQPVNRCGHFIPSGYFTGWSSPVLQPDPPPTTEPLQAMDNLERVVLALFVASSYYQPF